MKTFRELHIQGGSANTAKFIAAVDAALGSGWSRRVEEAASANDPVGGEHAYYVCEPTPQRPRALLAIYLNST